MRTNADFDLDDPRWMPLDYDAQRDDFMFVRVDEATLQSAFLDQRLGAPWNQRIPVDANSLPRSGPAHARPSWLFHTAFCCSTLLARALHDPPAAVALKEPHILLELARMSLDPRAFAPAKVDQRLNDAVRLLGRPWAAEGSVLVKPSNAVNRLLPRLLVMTPSSPALLLYGSLEDFLISCAKKLPGAEQPLRWMTQYLLPGTTLERALGIPSGHAFNFVESCVLIWHAQMEIYADALAADVDDRLRSLAMSALLDRPEAVVEASAAWLGLDHPAVRASRADRVHDTFSRNSKQVDARYGPDRRARERMEIKDRYGDLISAALAWSAQSVRPHARLPADWKPLPT